MREMRFLTILALCGLVSCQSNRPLYSGSPSTSSSQRSSNKGLSLKLARTINSMNSLDELKRIINGIPEETKDFSIGSRFGGEERSNSIRATPAHCIPELQSVPFADEKTDPSIVYIPNCTRIKRCGGCCNHDLLSCQPKTSVLKNFEVTVTRVNSEGGLTFREKAIIPLEEHTSCECDCRIKPEDCTGKQMYIEEECICGCTNVDEEEKCRRYNDTKLWHPTLCSCLCRNEEICSTGMYFDPVSCRCTQLPFSAWFGNDGPAGYRSRENSKSRDTLPLIVPLGGDNRRRKNKEDPEYK